VEQVRHPKQNLGLAQKLAPRTTGLNDPRIRGAVSGYTDEATKERDAKALVVAGFGFARARVASDG
jgi:hypothetical protein